MPKTLTLTEALTFGKRKIERDTTHEAGGVVALDETFAGILTAVNIGLDVSELKSLYIVCDRSVIVDTNDDAVPDNSMALLANVPYVWHEDSYHPLKFNVDISRLYVTNVTGSPARLQLVALYNPKL